MLVLLCCCCCCRAGLCGAVVQYTALAHLSLTHSLCFMYACVFVSITLLAVVVAACMVWRAEDAAVLGWHVQQLGLTEAALRAFEAERIPRVKEVFGLTDKHARKMKEGQSRGVVVVCVCACVMQPWFQLTVWEAWSTTSYHPLATTQQQAPCVLWRASCSPFMHSWGGCHGGCHARVC